MWLIDSLRNVQFMTKNAGSRWSESNHAPGSVGQQRVPCGNRTKERNSKYRISAMVRTKVRTTKCTDVAETNGLDMLDPVDSSPMESTALVFLRLLTFSLFDFALLPRIVLLDFLGFSSLNASLLHVSLTAREHAFDAWQHQRHQGTNSLLLNSTHF